MEKKGVNSTGQGGDRFARREGGVGALRVHGEKRRKR